jgi:uncharacterized protein (TIGR00369 family)
VSEGSKLEAPVDDGRCFGCGPESTIGLHMRFDELADKSVESRLTLEPQFQGWRGVAHGGIVALVLDEAMAYAAGAHGHLGVTAEMSMRFRKPVPTGEALLVRGKVLWQRRNVFGIEASIHDAAGTTLLASGEGSFVSRGKLAPGQRLGERYGGA